MNRKAIALMADLRDRYQDDISPIVISGCIGPQDDGYDPKQKLSADEAAEYHSTQIGTFADTDADMVTALTLTYVEEAIGIARAAAAAGLPVAISFTRGDGRHAAQRPAAVPGDRGDGRRDRRRTRLLHDQLRAPDTLRVRARRVVDDPDSRPPSERLHQEPRGARRGDGAGRRRPRGSRRALRPAPRSAARAQPARRMLRHRRSARRADLHRLDDLREPGP